MILNEKPYHDWLIDCVQYRRWSWPQIAFCLVHWVRQQNMSHAELLAKVKRDYQLAAERKAEK